ncbi:MAG: FGGY-family carbohydrate kinase [Flexilinea sp.]
MTKKYLIGVDLGTSSTKSALFTVDGRKIAEASVEVPIYYPKPGIVEQNEDDFYSTAAQTVKKIIIDSGVDPKEVAAIAFDSQMAGIGMIDEKFRPSARFDSWLDMRCQPYIDFMEEQCGDLITQITGCPPTCNHGSKILWWKNEQPEIYNNTAKYITPCVYVAGRMAGLKAEDAFIDYTYIHFSGFADNEKMCWSEEICSKFGLDMSKLPKIVKPWDVIGEVTEEAAAVFGLAPGTIIAAGAGDTAANALGAGIVKPGMLLDVAGTASILASCTDKYIPDKKNRALLNMRSIIPGLWNPLAYIGGGGIALSWFKDQFYNTHRGNTLPDDESLYSEMMKRVREITPGADGLLFSPHLGGRICPSSATMRGAWIGASWSHTQAHFFRAVLESIAFEYAYYLDILRNLFPDLTLIEARVVGGGAKGAPWNQIKADVLGVPYQCLRGDEFGTWGIAMVAGKAAGIIDNLAEYAIRTSYPSGNLFSPNGQNNQIYQPLIKKYIQMENLLDSYFKE